MIPVEPQPEPAHFDKQVRIPGKQFLVEIPNPTTLRKNLTDPFHPAPMTKANLVSHSTT